MKTILVVDDESKIRDVVVSYLKKDGFQTVEAETGSEAIRRVQNESIDFVILDLMLPDMEGEQVCQAIRQIHSVPILMLTAKVSENNRIKGLSMGADDYLIKPFDPREVVARVRAIMRRTDEYHLLADRLAFNQGELIIDSLKQQVFRDGQPVNLTPNEYKLLLVLAKHPQRHFSREELVERVLGYDFDGDIRTIDQHVKNIRQKIEGDPKSPKYIVTVYGTGYRFAGGTT
ncbi:MULTISPECIES: response regulator transcription factor [Paenibacillus]|uniref:Response regulator transcription factor n=1 Tax=Paenibacillus albicereus TaxID=2726185 RepID=A0A6H2GW69_9BACL|nr:MULTISPECIES: response regulator transcription factor [Paenibacillus]QGG55879.1 response regulator [Paenibacillus sp. B01]QJC51674.1 response regulator transcription factor [Paenibacillus albicereus]